MTNLFEPFIRNGEILSKSYLRASFALLGELLISINFALMSPRVVPLFFQGGAGISCISCSVNQPQGPLQLSPAASPSVR